METLITVYSNLGDVESALNWEKKAWEAGSQIAGDLIALAHLYGEYGFEKNEDSAIKYLSRLLKRDDPIASQILGSYYLGKYEELGFSDEAEIYREKGLQLLKKAALQGDSQRVTLGNYYFDAEKRST